MELLVLLSAISSLDLIRIRNRGVLHRQQHKQVRGQRWRAVDQHQDKHDLLSLLQFQYSLQINFLCAAGQSQSVRAGSKKPSRGFGEAAQTGNLQRLSGSYTNIHRKILCVDIMHIHINAHTNTHTHSPVIHLVSVSLQVHALVFIVPCACGFRRTVNTCCTCGRAIRRS